MGLENVTLSGDMMIIITFSGHMIENIFYKEKIKAFISFFQNKNSYLHNFFSIKNL